jgi:tetratricopeptide (TPR) repeat protein
VTYSTARIRQFLTQAFDDESIDIFCYDYFRKVHDKFTAGMSKGQKIQLLIVYCDQSSVLPALLDGLQSERREAFAQWFSDARGEQTDEAKALASPAATQRTSGYASDEGDVGRHLARLERFEQLFLDQAASAAAPSGVAAGASATGDDVHKRASAYRDSAVGHLDKGDLVQAVIHLTHAIDLDSKQADYFELRARCYRYGGEYKSAIADYERAIALAPDQGDLYRQLGKSYRYVGDYDKAVDNLDLAIEKAPKQALYYFERGLVQLIAGNIDAAIADLSGGIKLDDAQAEPYFLLGLAHAAKEDVGNLAEAIRVFKEAIYRDSKQSDYFYELGKAYYFVQKNDQAIDNFQRAIELNPNQADYYHLLARSCRYLGQHDMAIANYDRAIALNPSHGDYYRQRGKSYLQTANYLQAVTDLCCAITLDPGQADSYLQRGLAFQAIGYHDGAIGDFSHLIKQYPTEADYYAWRGESRLHSDDHKDAIDDLTQAIALAPGRWDYFELLGQAYGAAGDHQRAGDCYYRLGRAYALAGDHERAITEFTHAIEHDPDHADYYRQRAFIHNLRGDSDKANEDLNKADELRRNSTDAGNQRSQAQM